MRAGAQRSKRLRRGIGVVESQRSRAVIRDDTRQRGEIAPQVAAEQDGIGQHNPEPRQQQRRRRSQHRHNRQFLADRPVAKCPHMLPVLLSSYPVYDARHVQ